MLVLARKRDQSIMIGDDIEIVIVDVRGDQVKLGITAPRQIAVHRKEIYEQVKRETIEASKTKVEGLRDLETLLKKTGRKKE